MKKIENKFHCGEWARALLAGGVADVDADETVADRRRMWGDDEPAKGVDANETVADRGRMLGVDEPATGVDDPDWAGSVSHSSSEGGVIRRK